MPSRNSKSDSADRENYQQLLDQLEEILNTYNRTPSVLILGDMNASLHQRKGNNQDTVLKDFQTSNNFHCLQKGAETFFRPNKTDIAEIDFILFDKHSKQILTTVAVDSKTSLNTSDHRPIIGTLSLKLTPRTGDKQAARIMCKQRLDRCDKDYYQKLVRENLLPFDSFQLRPLTVFQNLNLSSQSRRSKTDPGQRRFMRLLKQAI